MTINWRATANLAVIKTRAKLLQIIREFFVQRAVLEVETPLLCQYAPTALHIDPIVAVVKPDILNVQDSGSHSYRIYDLKDLRYLQTSPEYAMKRLLACGIGDLFQITRSFRSGEIGRLHNPEFTILEWYRLGFTQQQLIKEVLELFKLVLEDRYVTYMVSYREIFQKYINIDPVTTSLVKLREYVLSNIELSSEFKLTIKNFNKKDCQELLFNHYVEPKLAEPYQIWCIYNYPAEQAALAKIIPDHDGQLVAERFEIYADGLELANGYHELLDPDLQQARFIAEQVDRKNLNKLDLAIDPFFMASLEHGLPSCSGVAVGVDRLLMVKIKAKDLREVICFPWDLA